MTAIRRFRRRLRRAAAGLAGRIDSPAAQNAQMVGQQVQLLSRELQTLRAQTERLLDGMQTLEDEMRGLTDGQSRAHAEHAEVRTRTRRTQALVARTYEALQGWPEALERARGAEDYEEPYTERFPLVSIPIPTFHSPGTLCDRALASVLAQTHEHWEAIVVGDHCIDDTEERVRALGDPRIRFHNLPVRENDPPDPWEAFAVKGSVPRSTGIAMSRGLWIAPLSHDDAWHSDHLATLISAAQQTRAEVVYSQMEIVAADVPGMPYRGVLGAYPPALGQWHWQTSMFHGKLKFLRYDRACALASEPNDWNLARRAWDAGVRFHYVEQVTSRLFTQDRQSAIDQSYAALGLPPSAAASP